MSDIFISYKREEQPTAKKLAAALERYGWSVWWDPHLRVGEHFDDVIEGALQEAKCVIVLWSRQSVASRYIRDEANYALSMDKLVPVAIEEVVLPFRFSGIQTAQLGGWDGADTFPEFHKLVDDIRSRIGVPVKTEAQAHPHPTPEAQPGRPEWPQSAETRPMPQTPAAPLRGALSRAEIVSGAAAAFALAMFYFLGLTATKNEAFYVAALVGLISGSFLLYTRKLYRLFWILAPLVSVFIGAPYSPRDADMGMLYALCVVVAFGVVDYIVFLRARSRRSRATVERHAIGKPDSRFWKKTSVPGPRRKEVAPAPLSARSVGEWVSHFVASGLSALFFFSGPYSSCFQKDIMAFCAMVGFPCCLFLLFRRRPYRIVWVAIPVIVFLIGIPYGRTYGATRMTPVFGYGQGPLCQTNSEFFLLTCAVLFFAVIDHLVFLHAAKKKGRSSGGSMAKG